MRCVPDLLEVLYERPGVPPVRVGRVDALGGEVVELLEVRVHHDFLLVGVLERLRPGNGLAVAAAFGGARGTRLDGRAPLQPGDVAPQYVHDYCLGDVVRVVAG